MSWELRVARVEDVPALEELIALSVRKLQIGYYSNEQIEAALGNVFGVDRQLIEDGTYYVVEADGRLIGAGGWSKRSTLYGSDHGRSAPDSELDPRKDAARIRAFFVHPDWARRGIGHALLEVCEDAIWRAGFQRIELCATLAGEPLYARYGYAVLSRYDVPASSGVRLEVVQMGKARPGS